MNCKGTIQALPDLEIVSQVNSEAGPCTVDAQLYASHDIEITNWCGRTFIVDIRGECQTPCVWYLGPGEPQRSRKKSRRWLSWFRWVAADARSVREQQYLESRSELTADLGRNPHIRSMNAEPEKNTLIFNGSQKWNQRSLIVQAFPGFGGPKKVTASRCLTSRCTAKAESIRTDITWEAMDWPDSSSAQSLGAQVKTLVQVDPLR